MQILGKITEIFTFYYNGIIICVVKYKRVVVVAFSDAVKIILKIVVESTNINTCSQFRLD